MKRSIQNPVQVDAILRGEKDESKLWVEFLLGNKILSASSYILVTSNSHDVNHE